MFFNSQCNKLIEEASSLVDNDFTPLMNKHHSSKEIFSFISNKKVISIVEDYFQVQQWAYKPSFFSPLKRGFNPHQDNTFVQAKENTFISAWVALTDVSSKNGGLIIWPQTHLAKQLLFDKTIEKKITHQDPNANSSITIIPENYKPFSPILKKGSVLFIDKWLVHASNTNMSESFRYSLLCTYIK